MPDRIDIIEQIKTDIDDKISSERGYNTDLTETRIGIFDPNEFTMLPAAGIWIKEDIVEDDLMDDETFRRLNLVLYAYVESDGYDQYTDMYNLITDFEKFLYSTDFTYQKNTILGDLTLTYGGATEQVGYFILNFSILYAQSGLSS